MELAWIFFFYIYFVLTGTDYPPTLLSDFFFSASPGLFIIIFVTVTCRVCLQRRFEVLFEPVA